ncbi:DUF6755 family protein [Sorangium sp. So ce1000]|uniref:DUF6755 family protein n=1 Tax=Sorangium sp. So ce1000 TaxID=3133325 RepID=UPI003F5DB368
MPIPGPKHDLRPGAKSAMSARLLAVAMLCAFQYWLLTSTVEAYNGGDRDIPLPALATSLVCFALGAGLVAAGELSAWRARRRPAPDA